MRREQGFTSALAEPRDVRLVHPATGDSVSLNSLTHLAELTKGAAMTTNGSYFDTATGRACTVLGQNGRQQLPDYRSGKDPYIAVDQRRNHAWIDMGQPADAPYTWYIGGGPRLVNNGVWCSDIDNAAKVYPGIRPTEECPRTAIGIMPDGRVLLVAAEHASLNQLAAYLVQRGVWAAMNLDGGGSTGVVAGGKTLFGGKRLLPNGISVMVEVPEETRPTPDEPPAASPQAYWDPFGGLMRDKLVIIDPGHGGSSPGGIAADGTPEKWFNLQVALALRDLLRTMGARVVMTRDQDATVSLGERVEIEHQAIKGMPISVVRQRVLYISIHHNTVSIKTVGGTEVWMFPGGNAEVAAKAVHRYLVAMLGTADRYAVGPDASKHDSETDFYVLRETDAPAILTEAGFLTNPAELALFKEPTALLKEATALALGVVDYFAELAKRSR